MTRDIPLEIQSLREELARCGPPSSGRHVPDELQARVVVWVRERRRTPDVGFSALAKDFGVSWATVARWLSKAPVADGPAIRRVELVPEIEASARGLVVHGPCGLRIEGGVEVL